MMNKKLKNLHFLQNEEINLLSSDYANRKTLLKLLSEYKEVQINTFAKSTCLRDMDCITIGNLKNPVLLCGTFHAMESITALLLIVFAFDVANKINDEKNNKNLKDILNKRGIFIIPCINPDGVEIFLYGAGKACEYEETVIKASKGNLIGWQANARGVDLNHNFDAEWYKLHKIEANEGIVSPSKTRYGGEYPESEIETKSLVRLCKTIDFSSAFAFHSQGEEIYWNFNGIVPAKSKQTAQMMSEKSGYILSSPEEVLASYGGFKDWFISYFNKPAFTIEVGKGVNPLPLTDLDEIYFKLRDMLFLLLEM